VTEVQRACVQVSVTETDITLQKMVSFYKTTMKYTSIGLSHDKKIGGEEERTINIIEAPSFYHFPSHFFNLETHLPEMASIDLHSTFDNTTSGDLYSNVTKKDDGTKVIRWNVGGARYEVSRWLIDMYVGLFARSKVVFGLERQEGIRYGRVGLLWLCQHFVRVD
jgi:hypothetical protein